MALNMISNDCISEEKPFRQNKYDLLIIFVIAIAVVVVVAVDAYEIHFL